MKHMDFEQFYLQTKGLVYQYLYKHVQDWFEAQDLAQQTYLIALEEWDTLKKHPNPSGWLMLTVKNLVMGYHRHIYYRMESMDTGVKKEVSYEETAFDTLVMEDFFDSIYGVKERDIAKKYFLEEDSIQQLSRELGISEATMRTRLYRMRKRMRYCIEYRKKLW